MVMGQPVGVVRQRGLLRQDRQSGQQRRGGVGEQVIDVGHPAGGRQLEGQQGQQPRHRGNHPGTGIACRSGQRRQVQGDQVRDGQQQPGHRGVRARRQRGEVDAAGGGKPGVTAGGGRARAGLRFRAAQQPPEPFLAQDAADGGAAQRGSLLAGPGADLIHRQAPAAHLDDPAAGGVFPGCALASRRSRRGEHRQLSGPQVADQRGERAAGVPAGVGCLLQRLALVQVSAQRLIPPLVHLPGQQFPARARGRYSGHAADLPQYPARRQPSERAR